jgi:hypothetical protein
MHYQPFMIKDHRDYGFSLLEITICKKKRPIKGRFN